MNIMVEGGLFLPRMDKNGDYFWQCDDDPLSQKDRLDGLLDGGAHMDDHTRTQRRKYRHEKDLPCHKILTHIVRNGYQRPALRAEDQRHH